MRVRLWGIRGTAPVCGRQFEHYGGETMCLEVELASGRHVILDCGSGLRALGRAWRSAPPAVPPVILFSHYHADHISELPFFAPMQGADEVSLYGPTQNGRARLKEVVAGLFAAPSLPVKPKPNPHLRIRDFEPGESFSIDGARIETCPSNHPGGCVAYRITADGWVFGYTGDHEIPLHGDDRTNERLAEFLSGADVVLVDSAFTETDHASHAGWGHSHFEQWPQLLGKRFVRHIVFAHYDPEYDDDTIDAQIAMARAAADGQDVRLHGGHSGMVLGKDGPEEAETASECEICAFSQRINAYPDTNAALAVILEKARELTGADAGSVYLVENGELVFAAAQNDTLFPGSAANRFFYLKSRVPIDEASIAGFVASTGKLVNIPDVYALDNDVPYTFNSSFDESSGYRTCSMLALPLTKDRKEVKGVLQLINCTHDGKIVPFTTRMERVVLKLAGMASIPLERALMTTDMIMRILELSALNDPRETINHVWRVGSMAAELYQSWAMDNKVDPEEMLRTKGLLRYAAMLHDVGKVAIPDAVLKKGSKLTEAEARVLKKHAWKGACIFAESQLEIDKMAHEIALHHHAMWDGSGYTGNDAIPTPTGNDIPFFARITAIADAYDTMLRHLVREKSMNPARQASFFLQQSAGKLFDPELVSRFIALKDVVQAISDCYRDGEVIRLKGKMPGEA